MKAEFKSELLLDRENTARDSWAVFASLDRLLREGGEPFTLLLLLPDVETLENFRASLEYFLSQSSVRVLEFPPWDVLPFDNLSPTNAVLAERVGSLHCLLQAGEAQRESLATEARNLLVLSTPESLLLKLPAPQVFSSRVHNFSLNTAVERDSLVELLLEAGYVQCSLVEDVGQFAVRGSVVDFYPPLARQPLRLELFAGVLDSIRHFDPQTQRSSQRLTKASILPLGEHRPSAQQAMSAEVLRAFRSRCSDLGLPLSQANSLAESLAQGLHLPGIEHLWHLVQTNQSGLWDYLPRNFFFQLIAREDCLQKAEAQSSLISERENKAKADGRLFPEPAQAFFSPQDYVQKLESLSERLLPANSEEDVLSLAPLRSKMLLARHSEKPFSPFAEQIQEWLQEKYLVVVVLSHAARAKRMEELLSAYNLSVQTFPSGFRELLSTASPRAESVYLTTGDLQAGLRSESRRVVLISERDVFPEVGSRRAQQVKRQIGRVVGSLLQLKENDYVVHVEHGVGIYRGLKQISVEGKPGDYLHLEYADEARLFLPVENLGQIQKYAGAGAKPPALSKLGTKAWVQTKAKVKQNVAELAGQLLNILAERELAKAHSFGGVDEFDKNFAATFGYDETEDQARAIQDVLGDLAKPKPMDRLVCGDVGYGKTEVAIRAAFKVAHQGKQVAVLVPTTILADQHYKTLNERFQDTGMRVACLSRFNLPAENKRIISELATGAVDVVVGTHRLLQKDVQFKDLGLIIIDEEHRFGVAHKERLKRFRAQVHVLTLTATPIPRTLNQSLVGIRDLSVIETPPTNRQVIQTHLGPYSEELVREVILRELGRNGQAFFIHNRVESIGGICAELQALIPEARIEFAHGQMRDTQLEEIMHRFVKGETDVLVSTTIVESGLDIPNANTIIIRNADRFGLAELYQLRGRVGRSSRKAYAYLLTADSDRLSPDARKRLEVLQSLDDLGVGFRLALQDMEIRGAGNLLGKDQSGHIDSVGYELYSEILKEAVNELKASRAGEQFQKRPQVDPEIRIGFPSYIPPDYVPNVAERLLLYQRLIGLRDKVHGEELLEEITDRFGQPPEEVLVLVELMVLRALLRKAAVVSAKYSNSCLYLSFHPQLKLSVEKLVSVVKAAPDRLRLTPAQALGVLIAEEEITSPQSFYQPVLELLRSLELLV